MNRRGFFGRMFGAAGMVALGGDARNTPHSMQPGAWDDIRPRGWGEPTPSVVGEAAMRTDRIAELRRLAAGDFTGHEYHSGAHSDVDAWRSVSKAGRWLILTQRRVRQHYAELRHKALAALAEYDRTGLAHYLFGD